ncbi:helix-turn-helix domain-containing protein [Streptomyces fructofermentans]|uniref:helix-turn-helix domain-containing protein n=1 Tax=Streptomyces fructofermentans TaxID=152141 RepID=UPI00379CE348
MTSPLPEQALATPESLRSWVAGIEAGSSDGSAREPFTRLPDAATKLVVRVEGDGTSDALVVGPRTRASYHASERVVSCVQVRLGPGTARPLLGVPALELVGRIVRLGTLPDASARQLARELKGLEPAEVVGHLAEVLPERLPARTDQGRREVLRAAVEALSTTAGRTPAPIHDLARRLAVSERQLRNLFAEGVGVSPKHFARIDRVRHVLAHAAEGSWAGLAASTGYYDQSHMTADFRTLMGVPPTSYFNGRLPDAGPCQALTRI